MPQIVLYGLPGSHPSAAVERALELKRLAFRRRDRLPVLHRLQHRILFGQGTAPAIRIDSRRLVGTLEIMGALDALRADPAMFPSDERAARVIEAARWDDAELQAAVRRLAWAAIVARPSSVASVLEGSRMVLPAGAVAATSRPAVLLGARLNRATPDRVRADRAALPALLDHADRLLAAGVLDRERPNAATLTISASVALLGRIEDVRPLLAGREIVELAQAHFPDYPGHLPAGSLEPASAV
jgi:glutathione S-transferase